MAKLSTGEKAKLRYIKNKIIIILKNNNKL